MAHNTAEREIERLIRQKEDELDALKATLRMISGEKSAGYAKPPANPVDRQAAIDLDSLDVDSEESGPTLAERVQEAVLRFPEDKEFTVPHIEAALKNSGFTVAGKSPRSRLAMIMSRLEKNGIVVRTARPKGFKPHRFKRVKGAGRNFSLVK